MDKFQRTRRLVLDSRVGSINISSKQCHVESQTTFMQNCSDSENTRTKKKLTCSPTTPFNICEFCPTISSNSSRSKKSLKVIIVHNSTDTHSFSCQKNLTSPPTIPCKKGLQGSPIIPCSTDTSIASCPVDLLPTPHTRDSQTSTCQKDTSSTKPPPLPSPAAKPTISQHPTAPSLKVSVYWLPPFNNAFAMLIYTLLPTLLSTQMIVLYCSCG